MKHKKNLFLCLIALLAIFSIVSCGGNELPTVPDVDPNKPVELPLKESTNLDAWREVCDANPNISDPIDINVKVTGTVTTYYENGYKTNTYLTDEKGESMFIYGKFPEAIKAGDKVTVTATKMMKYQGGFQVKTDAIKDVSVAAGTPATPRTLTTVDEFNALGTKTNLSYVTLTGRIVGFDGSNNFLVNILEKAPESTEDLKNPDTITPPEGTVLVPVRPHKVNADLGDICVFTGQMAAYNNNPQLMCFGLETIFEMPQNPKVSNFAEYQATAKLNKAATFRSPLDITGVVGAVNGKDLMLIEKDTNNAIHYRAQAEFDASIKAGQIITMRTKNVTFYNNSAQCSQFEIIETKAETVELATIHSWAKTTYKTINEINTDLEAGHGKGLNRDYVYIKGTVKKIAVYDGKNTGFYLNLPTEGDIYVVTADPKLKENDTVEVYGFLGSNKSGTTPRIVVPTYEVVTK